MLLNNDREVYSLLSQILFQNDSHYSLMRIISNKASTHEGSFPANIIECQLKTGERILLRLKYSTRRQSRQFKRKGIEYEAMVYNHILKNSSLSTPTYYGFLKARNDDLLLLGFLENGTLIKHAEPSAFAKAAKWIAEFHNSFEGLEYSFLKKLDQNYFLKWIDKIEMITANEKDIEWLGNLASYYRNNIRMLLEQPQTIIHGEFYGKNILIKDDCIFPLDWEACAIGPPEIDLAALMDGKDAERAKLAKSNYMATRFPNGVPADFEKKLTLAELYFKLRWIAEWVDDADTLRLWLTDRNYFMGLHNIARQLNCTS